RPAVRSQGRGGRQAGGHAVCDDVLLLPQGTPRGGGGRRADAEGPDLRQGVSLQDDLRWAAVGADAGMEVPVFPRADLEARRLHPEPQAHGRPVSMIRALAGGALFLLGVALAPLATEGATLAEVQGGAGLRLCANPEALPFSGQDPAPPGIQLELAQKIAGALGAKTSGT